jgi:hypothetical protein
VLAADLARVLVSEPLALSGAQLARRVGRRKADVLTCLRRFDCFEQVGAGPGSRWRLLGGPWEPMGTDAEGGARVTVVLGLREAPSLWGAWWRP